MQRNGPPLVLGGILMLALGAGVILAVESQDRDAEPERGREFQRLVGGLGLGPAVDLERCPASFDPRVGHRCQWDLGPIPGGGYFCPHHACSILYYSPLEPGS